MKRPSAVTPALLTSTSIRLCSCRIAAMASFTAAGSDTSNFLISPDPPAACTCARVSAAAASLAL